MRILIAEDEKELSNALAAILKHSKYSADQAFDGEEALDYIDSVNYDAVILDIMMPKKDGIEVIKAMRKNGDNTPVIMLTAKSEIDDRVLGLDSGADDYLTKPFDIKELLARLRAVTRRKEGNADNTLKFGNTSLNRKSFVLKTEDKEVSLNNKEFQIMEMMMGNSKVIISPERLFENIWGLDSDTEINAVWVYISNLRKKLKEINSNIEIKSIRNTGYKLEVKND